MLFHLTPLAIVFAAAVVGAVGFADLMKWRRKMSSSFLSPEAANIDSRGCAVLTHSPRQADAPTTGPIQDVNAVDAVSCAFEVRAPTPPLAPTFVFLVAPWCLHLPLFLSAPWLLVLFQAEADVARALLLEALARGR